ncbi:hypothetical protein WMF18_28930 [Sorangium sp. So ce315]|uniref:hypothetical protein n=1 Tax=Sorangium sp. So ce315 TaxID=3133299 RepID=UPI003F6338FE
MTGAATHHPPRQRFAPRQPPARSGQTCPGCAHLKGLLAEQRQGTRELTAGLAVFLAARSAERARRRRAAEPLYDYEAEADVLGVMLRGACPLSPALFAAPTHHALATAVATGELAPELLTPEMRGYRRGLMLRRCTPERLAEAMDDLVEAARCRRALRAAEEAVRALRRPGGVGAAREELRRALALLETPQLEPLEVTP